jgi:hypothetical protein
VNRKIRRKVRERAGARCEYCHIAPPAYKAFCIDHAVALQHGGRTALEILHSPACIATRTRARTSRERTRRRISLSGCLIPARMADRAFRVVGATLIGLTAIGRATIQVLAINEPAFLEVREILLTEQSGPLE